MNIIKVKSSQGSLGKNNGCELAPDLLIKYLDEMNLNESFTQNYVNVDEVKIVEGNIDETQSNIFNFAMNFSESFFLGGDHSITYSTFKAFSHKYKNPGILIFDAHPDCEVYTDIASHEDFVRKLIDEEILKKENIIIVGIRSCSQNETKFLKENKIKLYNMKDIYNDLQSVCDELMELCREFDGLYLSIDIDVVDPSFAPGTGYPEVGGLSSRDLIYFIQRIRMLKNLRFIDLVEINPQKDINDITLRLGAKIISELV